MFKPHYSKESNIAITVAQMATAPEPVEQLQSILTYRFANPRYLIEALRAVGSGYNMSQSSNSIDGNKRLAHVGDAVTRAVVLDDWYISGAERGIAFP